MNANITDRIEKEFKEYKNAINADGNKYAHLYKRDHVTKRQLACVAEKILSKDIGILNTCDNILDSLTAIHEERRMDGITDKDYIYDYYDLIAELKNELNGDGIEL